MNHSARFPTTARVLLIVFVTVSFFGILRYRHNQAASPAASNGSERQGKLAAATSVAILVNNTHSHQVMEGFGATLNAEVPGPDVLTASQRARALDAVYNQVKIRTGQAPTVVEAPSTGGDFYDRRANDNSDPFALNWLGYNKTPGDNFKQKVVDLVPAEATANIFPDVHINIRWGSPWLATIRDSDYNRFLDECAEQVLAGLIYWKDTYGREPRYTMLFNEPTSGNKELPGGSDQQVVDIIKRAGGRVRAAGFNTVKFVVPSQETEETSLKTARSIVADADARQYVGAISYHPYPYGSIYSYIPSILKTSGLGRPDAARVSVRNQLRDLGRKYGIPVWMNEVSHGLIDIPSPDLQSFDVVRGRAIHIHDELTYADAAAYYGMLTLWSTGSQLRHYKDSNLPTNPDDIVVTYQDTDKVVITGMGYAIGHYARWINRGAVRIESTSDDSLVQVIAFRDDAQGRFVLVAINNDSLPRNLNVSLKGLSLRGTLVGEQSTAGAYWQALDPFALTDSSSFSITVPALSVTTVATSLAESALSFAIVKRGGILAISLWRLSEFDDRLSPHSARRR